MTSSTELDLLVIRLARVGEVFVDPHIEPHCEFFGSEQPRPTTLPPEHDVDATQNRLNFSWRQPFGMIAETSPIDRCELRDVGYRIAVEPRVLLRQEDVAGSGRGAHVARENDGHGGLDRRAIEGVALEDRLWTLEVRLRTTKLREVVPIDVTVRDLRHYHGFLFMV